MTVRCSPPVTYPVAPRKRTSLEEIQANCANQVPSHTALHFVGSALCDLFFSFMLVPAITDPAQDALRLPLARRAPLQHAWLHVFEISGAKNGRSCKTCVTCHEAYAAKCSNCKSTNKGATLTTLLKPGPSSSHILQPPTFFAHILPDIPSTSLWRAGMQNPDTRHL